MTDEEKEAIGRLKTTLSFWEVNGVKNSDERIILNLLSKKDKVIKEMGSLLFDEYIHNYSTLDELIEAVYKKVEEENE